MPITKNKKPDETTKKGTSRTNHIFRTKNLFHKIPRTSTSSRTVGHAVHRHWQLEDNYWKGVDNPDLSLSLPFTH